MKSAVRAWWLDNQEGVGTKLMRSDLANRDLAIGDARLAADDCRSFQSCLSTASSIGDA